VSVGWTGVREAPVERARAIYRDLRPYNRPAWTDLTSAGPWRLHPGDAFDRHYHDCDEYWLIASGAALVEVEPEEVVVLPGDILCIERGRAHTVVELYAPMEAFWVEGPVAPGGRTGSLHRSDEEARGRSIPLGSAATRPPAGASAAVWRSIGGGEGPAWSDLAGAGMATRRPGEEQSARAAESDEYWLILEGRARLRLGADLHEVGAGDVVCMERGRRREVAEVLETIRYFWLDRQRQ
jgi:mannose-6-phosphate isomerase-like protein (cupin superfamily)